MMKKKFLRVVFIGCTSFSKKMLDAAISVNNAQIVGVVTSTETFDISYSEKPVKNYMHYDFQDYLRKKDIPFEFMSSKIKDDSLLQKLKEWKPDIFLVAGWYYMIQKMEKYCAMLRSTCFFVTKLCWWGSFGMVTFK